MGTVTEPPFASAVDAAPDAYFHCGGTAAARERRGMLWRLLVAGLSTLQVVLYAVPAWLAEGDVGRDVEALARWAGLALTLPVVAWAAGPFFRNAWRDLGARRVGMDVPVALGIGLMFAASAYATVRGNGETYFDSISMFVFLLLGARYLEAMARARAAEARQRLAGCAPAATEPSGIARLMDRAQAERPRIARLADRAAQWFVAALLVVAGATALVWYSIDPSRALWVLVSVLVVTCPCALSLATSAALTAATGTLHRLGMLVTRGHALETLARATHVVFDKTGTLTSGRLSLIGVMPLGGRDAKDCLRLAAALERASGHPVARALAAAAPGAASVTVTDLAGAPGQGVEARIDGRRVRIGSPAFVAGLARRSPPTEMLFTADGVTVVALGDEDGWIALLTFSDAPRPGARSLARALEARGLTVCLLSGDRRETAEHVARELGIGVFRGAATPQAKLDFVRTLQARGAVVAMVGDGVNDAPVLAQAQVSIVMGGSNGPAHAGADMVLLADDLDRLLEATDIARRTIRVIRQNLAWAAAYNAAALPLAMAGLVTPLVAVIGMAFSSLAVVLNALRLARSRRPGDPVAPSLSAAS